MIELIQFPWSPYCLVQRRILEFSGAPHRITNISSVERSFVWKLTKQRYYQVPIVRDGRNVVFETDDNSQVIAKYLDERLQLGLFSHDLDGIQDILWRFIDNDVESFTFKLNDAYFEEFVPRLSRITAEDVASAARQYLVPAKMTTLIVGDLDKIHASLPGLGLGPHQLLTVDL